MTSAVLGILVQLICKINWNKKQQRQFKWNAVSADNDVNWIYAVIRQIKWIIRWTRWQYIITKQITDNNKYMTSKNEFTGVRS